MVGIAQRAVCWHRSFETVALRHSSSSSSLTFMNVMRCDQSRCHSQIFNSRNSCHVLCSSPWKRHFSRFVDGLVSSQIKTNPPWKVLFFGTDEFALAHLKSLNENRIAGDIKLVENLEVVTKTKCAIHDYSKEAGLRLHEWPLPEMDPRQFDVGVVVSFGHLIPKRLINLFPYGILNVHPSIVPRWRGASPIIHTILNGDRETGISVMEIRPIHFDIGPLLMQVKFAIPDNCTAIQLRDYLANEGATQLMHALRDLPTLEKMEYEQNEYGVTYAHKLTPANARVNWEQQSPSDIDRQYRALSEMFGLRSRWRDQLIRLNDMVPLQDMQADDIQLGLENAFPGDRMTVRPGIPFYYDARQILCIRCKKDEDDDNDDDNSSTGHLVDAEAADLVETQDGWVGFHGITIKKPMTAKSFYNGYLSRPEFRATAFDSQSNDLDKFTFRSLASQTKMSFTSERLYINSRAARC